MPPPIYFTSRPSPTANRRPQTLNRLCQIFYKIFENRCQLPNGKRNLFVDVGANFGWYSVFAAAMGCRCGATGAAAGQGLELRRTHQEYGN